MVLLAFTLIAGLSGRSLTKGLLAAALGMFLATIGLDPEGRQPTDDLRDHLAL